MADDDDLDLVGGAGVFADEGAEPGEPAYWIWPSHGKVGARDHRASCADPWHGGCDCGTESALTAQIRSLLLDAGHRLVREHYRRKDERDEARQQAENVEFWRRAADWDNRILVGGSDGGWRLWQGNPPQNTGTVILPSGPIPGELDPQLHGLVDDAIGLYAIRDPRHLHKQETAAG